MDTTHNRKKNPNPRETANPLSVATLCYTLPTFFQGYKKDLEVSDLYETFSEHKSAKLGDKIEKAWKAEEARAKRNSRQPSLRRVLVKIFGLEFLIYGIVLAVSEICIRLFQPIFLGKLVQYFSPSKNSTPDFDQTPYVEDGRLLNLTSLEGNGSKITQPIALGRLITYYMPSDEIVVSKEEAYWYAAGVVACSLVNVFVTHPYMMGVLHVGMKIRVACCSLIYRKALKLSKSALGYTTAGQIVNLLSNDVNRFDVAVIFTHQLWVGPLETILITYFMYLEVGVSAIIGVIFLLMFIPLQFFLGKKVAGFRLKTALRTDERVRLMNEIISGIQVIKMYTWERPFAKLVSLARRYEIRTIRATSYIRGIVSSFIMFTTRISLFVTILSYVLFGNAIDARQVFVLTAFYNILRQSMTVFFPQGIAQIAEANVSIKRLNKFLTYDETNLVQKVKTEYMNGKSVNNHTEDKFELSVSHTHDNEYAVTIENGTAKWSESSTDNTLHNLNLKIRHGSLVAIIGTVGSGKTSLFHAILQELPLITGTLNVDGQISYSSQEPWLFPGSVRQNILFGHTLDKMHYKNVVKKCALERDFTLLPYGDKTIVGERGVSLSGGQRARINLARAVYKKADVYLLDDPLSAVDTHVGKQLFEGCIKNYLRDKTVILITHQLQYLKDVDQIILLEDGVITATGSFTELQESGLDFAKLLRDEVEQDDPNDPNKLARQLSLQRKSSICSVTSLDDKTVEVPEEVEETKSSGSISGYVYKGYLKAGASWSIINGVFLLFVLAQLAASAGDYYVTYWVNLEQKQDEDKNLLENNSTYVIDTEHPKNNTYVDVSNFWEFSRETSIYIYSAITVATIVVTLFRSFAFFTVCMRASVNLHDKMFESITHATMRFFNTNTSGRILNRFSKDMGAVDELLPAAMIDCLQIGLALIGIIIVVGIVNPWLMVPTVLIGVIFYFLRIFYLTTSRSIKRLEGVTRSPVFAYLNSSIQGLTTIRAFGAESILEKEFDNHQDLHSSAWFLFIATSRAFGFWLDLVCIIYIAIVTLSFLVLGDEKYGGNVGLAITQSIGLTGMFQWGMRQSTELENQMTSVERILEYSTVDHEPALESAPDKKPPKTWPSQGQVKFVNLFLKYFPNEPPVLKNLNFVIQPLEKVGIVGRTGAGKSSLIAALFRLTEIDGSIIIDHVDTKRLGLHDLRSKISIIPQEPVLFSGTMRKNLDPFDEYSDEVLWKALEEVELKEAVSDLVSGLNSKMSEGGSNFSVGQRQLVCLARAIIRNNKVLVLDEATANVDPQTDALIQHTIRKKFANCTVLTIAHRLHTVMDSDKVLVMDAGTMVEFDHPHMLLQNKSGYLHGMVQQTGKAMAEVLSRVAESSYKKIHNTLED